MFLKEYQKLASRTSSDTYGCVMNGCLGLIGKSGEVVDVVKKYKFQSGENPEFPKDKIIDECGDVMWYLAELFNGLGADMQDAEDVIQGSKFVRLRMEIKEVFMGSGNAAIIGYATQLSQFANMVFQELYKEIAKLHEFLDALVGLDKVQELEIGSLAEASALVHAVGVMWVIEDIMTYFCFTTLSECMERNIEKLKKRYPDGFDPERSMNREE